MPWDSTTLSSAAATSSQPSSYDIPEQPPPTTRMRSPHSGLPSSSRRSVIFFAATSVNVIMHASLEDWDTIRSPSVIIPTCRGSPTPRPRERLEDPARRQEGQLLERRVGSEPGHEQRRLGDLLRL